MHVSTRKHHADTTWVKEGITAVPLYLKPPNGTQLWKPFDFPTEQNSIWGLSQAALKSGRGSWKGRKGRLGRSIDGYCAPTPARRRGHSWRQKGSHSCLSWRQWRRQSGGGVAGCGASAAGRRTGCRGCVGRCSSSRYSVSEPAERFDFRCRGEVFPLPGVLRYKIYIFFSK